MRGGDVGAVLPDIVVAEFAGSRKGSFHGHYLVCPILADSQFEVGDHAQVGTHRLGGLFQQGRAYGAGEFQVRRPSMFRSL